MNGSGLPPSDPGLAARLVAALPAELSAVRPLPSPRWRALALLAIALVVAVALGFANTGKGWRALDAWQRWTLLGPVGLLACGLSWELSLRMTPGARLRWPAWQPAVIALTVVAGWACLEAPLAPMKLFYWICILFTSAGVGMSAWALSRYLRRGLVTEASTRVVLAAAAGLVGFVAVEFFCPFVDAAHILTSHVLPGVLAGGVAAWMNWREFR